MDQPPYGSILEHLMLLSERTRWAVEDAQVLIGEGQQERINDALCFTDQLRCYLLELDQQAVPPSIINQGLIHMITAQSYLEPLP